MSLETFYKIGKTVDAPLILASHRGDILAYNESARELLGLHSGQMALRSLINDEPEKLTSYLSRCGQSTDPVRESFNLRTPHASGERLTFSGSCLDQNQDTSSSQILLSAVPKTDDLKSASLNEKLSVLRKEVAHRNRLEDERLRIMESEKEARKKVEHLYDLAKRANHAKDEFLAMVSHELRTPLNAIAGWSQMLSEGDVAQEDLQEAYAVLHRNAQAQIQVINDLLDISRATSGKLTFNLKPLNPADAVKQAIESLRPAAAAKQIHIRYNIEKSTGLVNADSERLHQALWNILANAIKFGSARGIVDVELRRRNSKIQIVVTDDGEGIDPKFLPYIFDRFLQEQETMTRRHGGLGLGLALTKHIVEQHGGILTASSDGKGTGASFTIELPLTAIDIAHGRWLGKKGQSGKEGLEVQKKDMSLAGIRVLVVDDEPTALQLVAKVLRAHGASVMVASSVDEALQEVQLWEPHVLLSDIRMPDEDGYELIRKVRRMAEKKTPLAALALSAYSRREDIERSKEAGFEGHLVKPVKPRELVKNIVQALSS